MKNQETIKSEITKINWSMDSNEIVRAKLDLDSFINEQADFNARGISTPKIKAYHEKRIAELKAIILQA